MRFKRATAVTVCDVLRRLADWIDEEGKDARKAWVQPVNDWLDEALCGDAFGTEGQSDPRGDHRR